MPDYSQTAIYRAVKGAVKNVLDGHPNWAVPEAFARSVAKRAAGTLVSLGAEAALAAKERSECRDKGVVCPTGDSRDLASIRDRVQEVGQMNLLEAACERLSALSSAAATAGDAKRAQTLSAVVTIIKYEMERDG